MRRAPAFGIAALIAVLAAIAAVVVPHPIRLAGVPLGDIGMPLAGIEQFRHGGSPYDVRLRNWTPALYPFTTLLVLWPLRWIPLTAVVPTFLALVSFALAYAILRCGKPWQLLLFLSPPYWSAVQSVQWSPLFTAALLLPPLLPFAVIKPQLGVVLIAAGRWSRATIAAAIGLVVLSFVVWPRWLPEWLAYGNLRTFNGYSPVVIVPGFLLVAAVVAWRERSARILLALSVVVQRYFYDQLPLFLLARTWRELVAMLALSWSGVALCLATGWLDLHTGAQLVSVWRVVIVTFFLPALAIVMWNRRARRSGESEALP